MTNYFHDYTRAAGRCSIKSITGERLSLTCTFLLGVSRVAITRYQDEISRGSGVNCLEFNSAPPYILIFSMDTHTHNLSLVLSLPVKVSTLSYDRDPRRRRRGFFYRAGTRGEGAGDGRNLPCYKARKSRLFVVPAFVTAPRRFPSLVRGG